MKDNVDVAFHKLSVIEYPQFPYHPSKNYSELGNLPYECQMQGANEVYDAVRDIFIRLGLDKEHLYTPVWNPLGDFVKEGSKIFIRMGMMQFGDV